MKAALVVSVVALSGGASGCSSQSCTAVGCLDGIHITVAGFTAKFTSLPVTLAVCVGGACESFQVLKTGAAPECKALSATTSGCAIDGQGTLVLTGLPLPSGVAGSVSVTATVTDKSAAVLYKGMSTASVTTSEPNGPGCGVCESAAAAFAP